MQPLCGFYAAAISRVLQLFAVPGEAQMDACRAAGGGPVCSMSVIIRQATAGESAAA